MPVLMLRPYTNQTTKNYSLCPKKNVIIEILRQIIKKVK
jgi:hypothetical protein